MMNLELLNLRKDKINQFNKKGIYTVEDLVNFLPRRYDDFSKPKSVKYLNDGEIQAVVGVIEKVTNKNGVINVTLKDSMNWKLFITFFNQGYLIKTLKVGEKYLACGMVKFSGDAGFRTMTNPAIFTKNIEENLKIHPIYSNITGMSSSFLNEKINSAISLVDKEDYVENVLLSKYSLISKQKAIRGLHQPKTLDEIELAKNRLLFDELFLFNFKLKENSNDEVKDSFVQIKHLKKAKELMEKLPFELTEGQRSVLRNIVKKMRTGKKVDALVQGDVGVGKTIVAILLMVSVSENGYQSCLVAPTNILAKQHYEEIKEKLEPLGFNVGFLSSELKKREQNAVLKSLKNGELDMVVGTHSLMSEKVEFNNLGLSIIDEEHRFGVNQREQLNKEGVHKVNMSATPIPRSLALSMYGDMIDVETIKASPKGRKPIETDVISPENVNDVYKSILKELQKGRQAYIICPLITKGESEKMENIANIEEEYEYAKKLFGKHGFNVGMVTGQLKDDEINDSLTKFKEKEYDVLIATTIVEVGVNVPNSTVIMIKNAERFGFAQLHQLRGRVGRGNHQSYCYLISENKEKFQIFKETRDGFKIAEHDLLLRGAGSFLGTQQSGDNKFLMLMLANKDLNESIKKDVDEIYKNEKRLKRYRSIKSLEVKEL